MAWTKAKRSRYPADWKEIRARILERAGNCCEGSPLYPSCRVPNGSLHPITGSKVVLTISHFPDHSPANCSPDNLAARCQRCHFSIDRPYHLKKRKLNAFRKKAEIQPPLPFDPTDQATCLAVDLSLLVC